MPARSSYAQGTPNWVDLSTTDHEAAKTFYGELFGWTFDDQPIPGSDTVYSMALKGDGVVGAISAQSAETAAQNVPPMWNTYLAVDDVDAALARADAAGGKIAMPAFDVMDAGRMAFVIDPSGAPVALWQAKDHIGATLVNEPGALIWNDLRADDPIVAAAFYVAVFGLTGDAQNWDTTPYISLKVGGEPVAGISERPDGEGPSGWQIYFAVDDTLAVTEKAKALGGTALVEPTDTPIGPMATLADPQGAVFNVISIVPQ